MECNRDEALRAKSIAEEKMEKKDFAGAKKFALKAQTLYPGLDGISQILTSLDVYVAAENKISGEVDWYGVLSVSPSADEETIKKQYRKLALCLHPDKNKSVGADGAFQLISEAWTLLSDKAKRLAYNQRRGSRGFQQKVQMHTGGSSASPKANGIFNFGRTPSVLKNQNSTAKPSPPPPPPSKPTPAPSSRRSDTFWTICHRCKMHYEYLKMYLDHQLLCPNCEQAFMASETPPPFNFSKSSNQASRQRQQPSSARPNRNVFAQGRNVPAPQKSGSNSFRYSYQQGPPSGSSGVGSTDPSIAAKAATVVQQAQNKLKRSYTESHASAGREGGVQKRKLDDNSSRPGVNYNRTPGNGVFGVASGSAPGSKIYGFPGTDYQVDNTTRELTPLELRKMLSATARKKILNKLNSWRLKPEATKEKHISKERRISKETKKDRLIDTSNVEGHGLNGNEDQPGKVEVSNSADNSSKEDPEAASMNVPDPDFHDFDQDRSESSFGDNEVWSAYDDDDGMPRFYALINKVVSRNPFKLRISWLNSKTTTEFSNMEWVGSGFYKTCGEFRVGKYETCKSMNAFSQKVNWSKGLRGSIVIVPQKSDVWALYKNWSSDWNEHTHDEVVHKYDMVTVLDDYTEEQGVRVAPLIKVTGFKTVFRPNLDPEVIKRIPKEEMFRFSHRVPNHSLTGLEDQDAPEGCLELDPAATPLELLQVSTEGNEVLPMSNGANAGEEVLQGVPSRSLDKIAEGNEVSPMSNGANAGEEVLQGVPSRSSLDEIAEGNEVSLMSIGTNIEDEVLLMEEIHYEAP